LIYFFSSRPTVVVSEIYWPDFFFKKTIHLIEYGFLFVLLYRALKGTVKRELFHLALFAFVLTVLYAASDEYHQTFITGRTGTLRDIIIDSFGAGLTWWAIWKWLPKAPKKLKLWAKKLQIS
jgi:VanZ family protein